MCLFDELFCLCLVDARKMDIKPDRELKSWQRIIRPTRVVCGLLVDLTECDMAVTWISLSFLCCWLATKPIAPAKHAE
jgi:hypothetical protein